MKLLIENWRKYLKEEKLLKEGVGLQGRIAGQYGPGSFEDTGLGGTKEEPEEVSYEAGVDVSVVDEDEPKSLEVAFKEPGLYANGRPMPALAGERDRHGRELTPFWGQSIPESRREGIEELVRDQTGKVFNSNNEVYVMIDPDLDKPGRVPIYIYDSKGEDWVAIGEVLKKLGYKKKDFLHVPRSSAYDL